MQALAKIPSPEQRKSKDLLDLYSAHLDLHLNSKELIVWQMQEEDN